MGFSNYREYQHSLTRIHFNINPEDLALKKMLVAGTDIVGIDSAAAKILEVELSQISYLGMAQTQGLGTTALETLKIERITL